MIFDYPTAAETLKNSVFSKEENDAYWYVLLMGTLAERRHQGLAGKILLYMQDKARRGNRPLYLEASNQASRQLFLKHGFQEVGEIVVGKGVVGSDGIPKEGGEGVPLWGMIWRP